MRAAPIATWPVWNTTFVIVCQFVQLHNLQAIKAKFLELQKTYTPRLWNWNRSSCCMPCGPQALKIWLTVLCRFNNGLGNYRERHLSWLGHYNIIINWKPLEPHDRLSLSSDHCGTRELKGQGLGLGGGAATPEPHPPTWWWRKYTWTTMLPLLWLQRC